MIYASLFEALEERERLDLRADCLEFDIMKLLVSNVAKLLSSVFSPLAFVANNMSDGIVRRFNMKSFNFTKNISLVYLLFYRLVQGIRPPAEILLRLLL